MKKILSVLISIVIFSFLCFVQQSTAKSDETKTFIGKIEKVSKIFAMTIDKECVEKIKITVIENNGKESTFSIPGTMHITGEDTIVWDRTETLEGKRVEISTNNSDEVISIRFLD